LSLTSAKGDDGERVLRPESLAADRPLHAPPD
jgi:hypothetical protein